MAHCEVQKNGDLEGCQLIKETPENKGFGKAALMLAARFRRLAGVGAGAGPRGSLGRCPRSASLHPAAREAGS